MYLVLISESQDRLPVRQYGGLLKRRRNSPFFHSVDDEDSGPNALKILATRVRTPFTVHYLTTIS